MILYTGCQTQKLQFSRYKTEYDAGFTLFLACPIFPSNSRIPGFLPFSRHSITKIIEVTKQKKYSKTDKEMAAKYKQILCLKLFIDDGGLVQLEILLRTFSIVLVSINITTFWNLESDSVFR